MKLNDLLEQQKMVSWQLGDHDLGEQEFGEGTVEDMIAAAKSFSEDVVDVRFPSQIDIDYKNGWIITGSPAGEDEPDPRSVEGTNLLPDGRYIVGSFEVIR